MINIVRIIRLYAQYTDRYLHSSLLRLHTMLYMMLIICVSGHYIEHYDEGLSGQIRPAHGRSACLA